MADTRTVAVKLQADVNGYRTSMKQAAASTDQLDKAQEKAQKTGEKWKAIGMASQVAGAAVAAGLLYATKAASNQEQAVGALTATFKVNSAQMLANAKSANQMGLSITDYSNAAAKLGAQLSNLGVDQADLGAMTDDLVRKAADLAAQFGGSTQDAVDALGAAFRGEADPAERYGLALNITAVNAEMAATGVDKATAMMSLLNKQMAKSGAAGAMAREFDTAAAATGRAQANFDDATAALGEALLPAMATAASAASDLLGWFNGLSDGTKETVTYLVAFGGAALLVGPKLVTLASGLTDLRAKLKATGDEALATKAKIAGPAGLVAAFGAMKAVTAGMSSEVSDATGISQRWTDALTNVLGSGVDPLRLPVSLLTEAIRQLGVTMDWLPDTLTGDSDIDQELQDYANRVNAGEGSTQAFSDAINAGKAPAEAFAIAVEAAKTASQGSADASYADAEAKENQAAALKKATEQYEAYLAAVQQALGLMSARDALIGQETRLSEAIKKNGNALRGQTAAAAANREAIGQEVSKITDLVQAKYEETGSLKAANKVRREQVASLMRSAEAAGYDREQTRALLKQLNLLKPIRSSVTVDGLAQNTALAERLASALSSVVGNSGLGKNNPWGGFASGGYISGPGSGTSDSIPAMLSNGEYVMTAKATKRLGVSRLNAMNYAGGGLVGYASGGSVGIGQANLAVGAGKALRQVQKWRDAVKVARQNVRDLAEQVRDYADSVASNALTAGGEDLFDAFTRSGIAKSWQDLAAAQDKVATASKRVYDAQVAVNTASPEQRAAAIAELAAAQRDLADAQGEQTAAETAAADAAPTAEGILGRMRERARLVTEYATKVKSLMGKGLSMALIKDLAGADPVEAGPVLDALLKMNGKQLKELGALDSQARGAAESLGTAVSKKVNKKATKAADIELRATTKQLDKDIRTADRTLDRKWRKVLAAAGLGAEERVQLMQSIRDNDGKLTTHWRNVLANAGLGAEERGDILAAINGADTVLTTHWRNKLATAGLSAEDRGDLMASLIANDGKLTREWRDKLAAAGLSAAERNNLITNGIRDADTKARVDWANNSYAAGLDADKSSAETKLGNVRGDATNWRNTTYASDIDARKENAETRLSNVRADAKGWAGSTYASDINGERKNWSERIKGVRDDANNWKKSTYASSLSANANRTGINAGVAAAKAIIQQGFSGFTISIGGSAGSAIGRGVKKPRRATGGIVLGAGTGTSDSIPVRVSNGEYVIRAASVKQYGADFMDAVNMGRFATGGPVGFRTVTSAPAMGMGGLTLATSGVPIVVKLDNRTLATGQLKLRRQSGGTVTLGG